MLDRMSEFKKLAVEHGLSQGDFKANLSELEQSENHDRELINDFLFRSNHTQDCLVRAERNNVQLRDIAHSQIYENKQASQEIDTSQINSLIDENGGLFREIKTSLAVMNDDIAESVIKFPNEPEIRVKKTIHRTYTHKFRDVIRNS